MRWIAFLFISFCITACCSQQRPSIPDDVEDLIAALRAQAERQPTIRGELRVDRLGPEGRIAGKVYAFAAKGGRLRMEAVGTGDLAPVSTVKVDGRNFVLIDHQNRRCLRGGADPCHIGDALGIELSSEHVGAVLLGVVPIIEHESASAEWDCHGYYVVELEGRNQGWTQRVHLSQEQGRLVATKVTIAGPRGTVLEMELDSHRAVGRESEFLVPHMLSIQMPQSEADLRVLWREIEVDVDLPESAWDPQCLPGFVPEFAQCQGSEDFPELEPPGFADLRNEADHDPEPADAGVDGDGVQSEDADQPVDGDQGETGDPDEINLDEELGF